MRILVVHQYYLLPSMPGGSRFNEFARLWSDAGHQVTVIAGTVDYLSGKAPERYRHRWLTREHDGKVEVWRCHVPQSYGKGYAGRMWAFAGFTLSALTAALRVHRPDVVIATSPPLVAVIPGWAAARLHRAPWVFEIRDLWPESAVTTGVLSPDGALTKLLYRLERFACSQADAINVLTPAFREDLLRRGLATAAKLLFVPNGADLDNFKPAAGDVNDGAPTLGNGNNAAPAQNAAGLRQRLGWGKRIVALYAGAHGRANAIGQLVDTAAQLRHRPDILIACVGDGPERATHEAAARKLGLDNIQFYGSQPKEQMPAWINASDIGIAVLQNNPTFRTVYPNKVFDYMACEKPVLLAIDGVARELVCDQAEAGVFATPEDPQAIATALIELADHPDERRAMGQRGRAWVVANASREGLAQRYLQALQRLANVGRRNHVATVDRGASEEHDTEPSSANGRRSQADLPHVAH